jgi:RHS repeat-associated protein
VSSVLAGFLKRSVNMSFIWWPQWLRQQAARTTPGSQATVSDARRTWPGPRRKTFRPTVTALEDRILLSTFHWFAAAGGDFNVAANWRDQAGNPGVPGPADDATIGFSGITVTVSGSTTVHSLDLTAATLSVTGTFTVNGTLHWTGGKLGGGGQINIANTGSLDIGGDNRKDLDGVTLDSRGAVTWAGTGTLYSSNAAVVHNRGTWDAQADVRFALWTGARGTFNNYGTLRRSAGAGTADFDGETFNNWGGAIDVQSGTLDLSGGTSTGGVFTVAAGAALDLSDSNDTNAITGSYTGSGGAVRLSAGTLAVGAAGATFNFPAGMLQWTGGTIAGPGTLTSLGGLAISGVNRKDLDGVTLDSGGAVVWTGTGTLYSSNAAVVHNRGTWDAQADARFAAWTGARGTFHNHGTLRRSAGAGTADFDGVSFNNPGGAIDVQSGTLDLSGGTSTGGSFTVAPGAVLDLSDSNDTNALTGAYTGSGGGAVRLSAGTLAVGAAGATFNFAAGILQWTGGTIAGPGTLTNLGGLAISGVNRKDLDGVTLDTRGAVTWAGTGTLYSSNAAVVHNRGTWDAQADARFAAWTGARGTFHNHGTLRRSAGAGIADFDGVSFNNPGGAIDVQSGTLDLSGGTSTGGAFTVAPGAVLDLSDSNESQTVTGAYTGSGGGAVRLSAGTLAVGAAGASFDFPAGMLQWTGGTIAGPGTLTSLGGLAIYGVNRKDLDGVTLDSRGAVTWAGTGTLYSSNAAVVHNRGTWDAQADVRFALWTGARGMFNNYGTLRRSAGAGTADFDGETFNNWGGAIDVQSGTLDLSGGTSTGGSFAVAAGAALDLSDSNESQTVTGAYTGSGGGAVRLSAGTLAVGAAGATFNFAAGMLQWTGGTLAGPGTLTDLGELAISGANRKDLDGLTLKTVGAVTWTGIGTVYTSNGAVVNNRGSWDALGDADLSQWTGARGTFNNFGTLTVTHPTAAETTGIAITFNNAGTVNLVRGELKLSGPVVQLPAETLTGGTWNVFANSTLTFPSRSSITTNRANVTLNGPGSNFPAFNVLDTNEGSLSLQGGRNFTTAGALTNSGRLTVGPGSTLAVAGAYTQTATGTYATELGGEPATGQFGRLTSTGAAALDGTFALRLVNDYGPHAGGSFQVMTYPSHTGAFAHIDRVSAGRGQLFDVAVNPTDVVASAVRDANDLAVGAVTMDPAGGVVGQDVTVHYEVHNTSAAPTSVSAWTDSIYLSADDVLDAGDALLGRVGHTGVVAANGSYEGMLTAPLPGVRSGDYHVIVLADSRGFVADPDRANNIGVLPQTVHVAFTVLTPGVAATGTIKNGQDLYFQVDLAGGDTVRVHGDFFLPGEAELYVRFQDVPSRATYDQSFFNPSFKRQEILLDGTQAGTFYVLLHGTRSAVDGVPFSLTAEPLGFQVLSLWPNIGENRLGRTTVTVTGSGFSPDAMVSLVSVTGGLRNAVNVLYRDGSTLYATFDLTGLAEGVYAMRVTDGGRTTTLENSFTVRAHGAVGVRARLLTPDAVRIGRTYYVTVLVENLGDIDMPAPLLVLSANIADLRLPEDPDRTADSVMILGINTQGPGGTLPPHYSRLLTIPFVTRPVPGRQVKFKLGQVVDLGAAFDWASLKDGFRPPDVPADAWDAIWGNFAAGSGSTMGDLQSLLGANATYLSLIGENVSDVSRLLAFEFSKASAGLLGPVLASAGDVSFPAPGLDLSFNRVSLQPIDGRYRLGRLGRGWVDNWDISLVTDAQQNVTVRRAATSRPFTRQADDTYQGTPGDPGRLSLVNGVFTLREGDGSITGFRADGALDYVEDPNGNRITAGYTGGQLTSLTHSNGRALTLAYNAQGRIRQVTDPAGRVTTYDYDPSGEHLIRMTTPRGQTEYGYVTGQGAAREHALASITSPDLSHSFFEYDARGRLINQHRDGGAEAVTFGYGPAGGYTRTDAAGTTTILTNEFGQPAQVRDPVGGITRLAYDGHHNLVQVKAPLGATTSKAYDDRGNLTDITDPLGGRIHFTYDTQFNQVQSFQDARGRTTLYGYDAQGNLTEITDPAHVAEHFAYDDSGSPDGWINRRGQAIDYTYDSDGRLHDKNYPDGSSVVYEYNSRGNLHTATDVHGTTVLDYDPAMPDRLQRITYPGGRFLHLTYDAGGRRERSVDQDGFVVKYHYDAAGRLDKLLDAADAPIVTYAYEGTGRLRQKDFANGTVTTYEYDASGQLLHLINRAPGGAVNSRFDYTYDALGRRTTMTTADGITTYGYDLAGQLTSVTLPGGRNIQYHYDAAGNRTTVTDGGVTTAYTTNDLNQYTAIGAATFGYDADGNQTSRTVGGVTQILRYDSENRLVGLSAPGDAWSYEYDPFGNRIATTHNGQRTEDLIDPVGLGYVTAQYGPGGLLAHYTHGLGLTSRVDATSTQVFYDFDALGSTVGLSGPAGGYVNTYRYLPFGETSVTGTVPNPFQYVGQLGVMAEGNGLQFMRARFYDPGQGRFIQADPIGIAGGLNVYRYVANDPVRRADPSGLAGGDFRSTMIEIFVQAVPAAAATIRAAAPLLNNGNLLLYGSRLVVQLAPQNIHMLEPLAPALNSLAPAEAAVAEGAAVAGSEAGFASVGLLGGVAGVGAAGLAGWQIGTFINDEILTQDQRDAIGDFLGQTLSGEGLQTAFDFYFGSSQVVNPKDPNEIIGPAGFGPGGHLTADRVLPYTIRFENKASASAAAQEVVVTQQLDPDLDFTTFELGAFGFGSLNLIVLEGRSSYQTRVDDRAVSGLFVDVSAGIDLATGVVTWHFTSIDPATGDLPADALAGFLPPNKTAPQGEGFVTYTVRAKAGAGTGTRFDAQASIVFDTEAPLATAPIFNTIDAGPPASSVNPLPATLNTPSFLLSWSGSDDAGGSGIATFDVFVSVDGGAFAPFLTGTTQTAATFTGAFGHRYAFYSVATDNLGFRQATPAGAQASTTLVAPPKPVPVHPVSVSLAAQGRGPKKRLVARVMFSDGSLREVRAPFQKPLFQGIAAALDDLDHDGFGDGVRFTARKGRKKFSRVMSL